MDPVPSAGFGGAAVGHRPSGGAFRAGQQQSQVASGDIGERRQRGGIGSEPEVGRVEVDGGPHVVHHVSDADSLLGPATHETSIVDGFEMRNIRNRIRLFSAVAVRWNAGYPTGWAAGSGMLQCTGCGWPWNSGQTSRTRSQSVIT